MRGGRTRRGAGRPEREGQARAILDCLPVFVGVLSLDGRLEEVNRLPLETAGLSRAQVIGRPLWQTPFWPREEAQAERLRERLARAARGELVQWDDVGSSPAFPDRVLLVTLAPLRGASGAVERIVASTLDVTGKFRAERERDATEARLRTILATEPDAVIVFGPDGRVQEINPAGLALLESDRLDEVVGRGVLRLVDPEHRAAVVELHERAMRGEAGTVTFAAIGLRGTRRWLESHAAPFREGDAIVAVLAILRDVTERKRHERERERLLEAEQVARVQAQAAHARLVEVLERISDGFVALDRNWRYTYVNRNGARMLGRAPEELVGRHIWTEFPEGVGQPFHQAYERAMAEQVTIELEQEYTPWGRWFENRIYPSPEGIAIFYRDVTDRKRTEQDLRRSHEQLRALAARLQDVREEERRAIAREIHDRLGQALTSLKLDLSRLERRLPAAARAAAAEVLGSMASLLDETLAGARRLSSDLRPGVLDDLGLLAAIEWQAGEFERRTGVRCAVALPEEEPSLDPARLTAVFRIFQEALTNVARHAGARSVRIALRLDGDLRLEVVDDGRGMTEEERSRPDALGLLGMQERALAFGGEVRFEGRPGQGTSVSVRIPLRAEAA